MGAYPRFRFDTRFDAAGLAAAAKAPDPAPAVDPLDEPRHSERELRRAVAAAEARGFAQGAEHGRTEAAEQAAADTEARIAETLAALSAHLAGMDAELERAAAAVEAHGTAVVLALVRRLAPRLMDAVAREDAETLALQALRAARNAPELRVRVAAPLAEAVRTRMASAHTGSTIVEVEGDPALALGAVRAAWAGGALDHDPAAVLDAVASLTDRIAAGLLGPTAVDSDL